MSKVRSDGTLPSNTYGSVMTTPLTVSLPSASQQTTRSPGRPISRLIRWLPESLGSSPTKVIAVRSAPRIGPSCGGMVCGNHPPGSVNTTTSPRCRSNGPGVSLLTTTRSPTSSVLSIDSDGMKNACTRNVLTSSDRASAMATTMTVSRSAAKMPGSGLRRGRDSGTTSSLSGAALTSRHRPAGRPTRTARTAAPPRPRPGRRARCRRRGRRGARASRPSRRGGRP